MKTYQVTTVKTKTMTTLIVAVSAERAVELAKAHAFGQGKVSVLVIDKDEVLTTVTCVELVPADIGSYGGPDA